MEEIWKEIKDYPGYEVSNIGNVRNALGTCKSYFGSGGYIAVPLRNDKGRKTLLVHRLVLMAFCPTNDVTFEVNHKDCNKANNRLSNLEWVTHAENMYHAEENGRMDYRYRRGIDSPLFGRNLPKDTIENMKGKHKYTEDNKNFKLTDEQVYEIKKERFNGCPLEILAIRYNVEEAAISLICRGKRRSNIAPEYTVASKRKPKGRKLKRITK